MLMACIAKCNDEKYMCILYQTQTVPVCVIVFAAVKFNIWQHHFSFQAVNLAYDSLISLGIHSVQSYLNLILGFSYIQTTSGKHFDFFLLLFLGMLPTFL